MMDSSNHPAEPVTFSIEMAHYLHNNCPNALDELIHTFGRNKDYRSLKMIFDAGLAQNHKNHQDNLRVKAIVPLLTSGIDEYVVLAKEWINLNAVTSPTSTAFMATDILKQRNIPYFEDHPLNAITLCLTSGIDLFERLKYNAVSPIGVNVEINNTAPILDLILTMTQTDIISLTKNAIIPRRTVSIPKIGSIGKGVDCNFQGRDINLIEFCAIGLDKDNLERLDKTLPLLDCNDARIRRDLADTMGTILDITSIRTEMPPASDYIFLAKLINSGADLEYRSDLLVRRLAEGKTLLHLFCEQIGHNDNDDHFMLETVERLLKFKNTQIDIQDKYGNTALLLSTSQGWGNNKIRLIPLLLEAGADMDIANEHGDSPKKISRLDYTPNTIKSPLLAWIARQAMNDVLNKNSMPKPS